MEALDNYIDSIKTLPRDWNPKAYIEPPGGESEHEKGLQVPEEEVIHEFLSVAINVICCLFSRC